MVFWIGCSPMAMIWDCSRKRWIRTLGTRWAISRRLLRMSASSALRLRWKKKNGASRIPQRKRARIQKSLARRHGYELVKLAVVGISGDDCAYNHQRRYAGAWIDADELSLRARFHAYSR